MQKIKVIKRVTGAHTVEDIPRIEQQIKEFSKKPKIKDIKKGSWSTPYGNGLATYTIIK